MKSNILHSLLLSAATLLGFTVCGHTQTQVSGAGATFPAPLYQRWAVEFAKENPDVQISYQSVGSGAGVKQFLAKTVDFGASDAAMSDKEIAQLPGTVLIPATAGSVVLAYNLDGVAELRISRAALEGIVLGTVKKWNDPLLVKDNPGVKLPDLAITFAYRSDGSGTTYVFTNHLVAMSEKIADEVGNDKQVQWPVGVGGKGNEGVTALVKQTPGSIGYVEYGYAENNGVPMAFLENKAGKFIMPTPESGAATMADISLPENLRAWAGDPAGEADYPIVSFTWLLLYPEYSDAARGTALKKFVDWGLTKGQSFAKELGYIPLPETVIAKSQAALAKVQVK